MTAGSPSDFKTDGKRRVGDGTPGPGRPKGLPNKMTVQVKEMILAALDKAGGVNYLAEQADKNPSAFLTLVGKVLPLQITGDADAPVTHRIEIVGVMPE